MYGSDFLFAFDKYVLTDYDFFEEDKKSGGKFPSKSTLISTYSNDGIQGEAPLDIKDINEIYRNKLIDEIVELRKFVIESKESENSGKKIKTTNRSNRRKES